jgi:GTP pyrophosphokinase
MSLPSEVIAAALLHDTVEDTNVTLSDLKNDFGDEVAKLVDGVTKLTQLPRVSRGELQEAEPTTSERLAAERRQLVDPELEVERLRRSRDFDLQSETLRKTFLAMSDDVRVVLIKLADRLHNMRTLDSLPEAKQVRIARQTLDIFAPLANRLGIWNWKWELEDKSFKYINPARYEEIARSLADTRPAREKDMLGIKARLEKTLAHHGIHAEVTGRPKHIYSIHKKMTLKGISFDQVMDLRGMRVLVQDIPECYAALGYIHATWRPIPKEFDDYIANPKDNFYRSLHTTVIYDDGKPLEIQIRTFDMNRSAELGIASHWRYKDGVPYDEEYENRLRWLRSLMDWRQDVEDAREFVDGMKSDVFEDRVYILTPRGDIIDLPAGSTPIDFAYHVHTEVGNRCRGAKVNGKLVTLDYQLKTGEQVQILLAKQGGPSRDWLNPNLSLVKTQRARSKIKQWFRQQAREQNLNHGRSILEKELRRLGMSDTNLERLAREFDYKNIEELYVALGTGEISISRIVRHLTFVSKDEQTLEQELEQAAQAIKPVTTTKTTGDSVSVVGLKGLLTSIARCCNPTSGDPIVGYITRGRGVTVHRQDCPNILRMQDRERLVQVSWGETKRTYPVPVRIKAYERMGLVKDVSTLIADEGINMLSLSSGTNKNLAWVDLVMEVRDLAQLSRILDRLENLPNVTEVIRVRPG